MKILILTQHFPPETVATGRRAFDLAEAFAARGDRVVVLCGRPNHPASLSQSFCQRVAKTEKAAAGYLIHRVPVFRSPHPSALKRFLTYATFMLAVAWRAMRQEKPDLIMAISPLPTGIAAMLASWWHGAPLVFDLQDIWPDSARAVGVMKRQGLLGLLKRVERFFYRQCTAIVGISEGFREYLLQLGIGQDHVSVIHNGVDWESFANVAPDTELSKDYGLRGKFVIGYVGNHGVAQQLDTVLSAAASLSEEEVAFLLIGEGTDKSRLVAQARVQRLNNVHFLDGRPRHQIPQMLKACDALLVILKADSLFEVTIPSKLYEYMAAGKPILCSVPGETANLVERAGCGLRVAPSDGRALAEAVRALRSDRARCQELGQHGTTWVRAHFSRHAVMDAYVRLADNMVLRGRTRSLTKREGGEGIAPET